MNQSPKLVRVLTERSEGFERAERANRERKKAVKGQKASRRHGCLGAEHWYIFGAKEVRLSSGAESDRPRCVMSVTRACHRKEHNGRTERIAPLPIPYIFF